MDSDYIFFLQLSKQLPEEFFQLSAHLSDYKVSLVPIFPKELLEISKGRQCHVITFVNNIDALKNLLKVRKIFLDWGTLQNRFSYYNFTSFDQAVSRKLKTIRNYHHFPLPMGMKDAAINILNHFWDERSEHVRWPGGRSPQLSKLIST